MTKWGGNPAMNALVSNYRIGARERGYSFDLTHDQCYALMRQNCHYCGRPPGQALRTGRKRQYVAIYTGLDRIDNSQGYTPGNVVPCCKTCNSAKGAMTVAEFREWISCVSKFLAHPAC